MSSVSLKTIKKSFRESWLPFKISAWLSIMVTKTRLELLRHGVVALFITHIPWNVGHGTSYLPTRCKALQKYSLVLGLGQLLCCNTDTTTAAQRCTWAFGFYSHELAVVVLPLHSLTQMFSVKEPSSCLSHI